MRPRRTPGMSMWALIYFSYLPEWAITATLSCVCSSLPGACFQWTSTWRYADVCHYLVVHQSSSGFIVIFHLYTYTQYHTVINTYTHRHITQIDQIYLLFQALTLWTFSMKTRESGNEARPDSFILSPSLQPFHCLCMHLRNIPCTAQQFFARHSQRQETFYEEEQLRLKSITTPQQMLHNDLVDNFR